MPRHDKGATPVRPLNAPEINAHTLLDVFINTVKEMLKQDEFRRDGRISLQLNTSARLFSASASRHCAPT